MGYWKKRARKLREEFTAKVLLQDHAEMGATLRSAPEGQPAKHVSAAEVDQFVLSEEAVEKRAERVKAMVDAALQGEKAASPKSIAKRQAEAAFIEANTLQTSVFGRVVKGDGAHVSRLDQLLKATNAARDVEQLRSRLSRATNPAERRELESKLQKAEAELQKGGAPVSLGGPRFGAMTPEEADAEQLRRNAAEREAAVQKARPSAPADQVVKAEKAEKRLKKRKGKSKLAKLRRRMKRLKRAAKLAKRAAQPAAAVWDGERLVKHS